MCSVPDQDGLARVPHRELIQIPYAPYIKGFRVSEHFLDTGMKIEKVLDSTLCRHILDNATSALCEPLNPPVLGMIRHDLEVLRVGRDNKDALPRMGAEERGHARLLARLEGEHRIIAQHSFRHGAQVRSKPAGHCCSSTRNIDGARVRR